MSMNGKWNTCKEGEIYIIKICSGWCIEEQPSGHVNEWGIESPLGWKLFMWLNIYSTWWCRKRGRLYFLQDLITTEQLKDIIRYVKPKLPQWLPTGDDLINSSLPGPSSSSKFYFRQNTTMLQEQKILCKYKNATWHWNIAAFYR